MNPSCVAERMPDAYDAGHRDQERLRGGLRVPLPQTERRVLQD